jgi:hypothetical protein
MKTSLRNSLCWAGLVLVAVSCGKSGTDLVATPVPTVAPAPPQIRSVAVIPPAITLGGTAQVSVDAFDPRGSVLVCRFSAQAGQVSVPDPARDPCKGVYTNDGTARTSDTITVVATNAADLSVSATAPITLNAQPPASPPPRPAPVPTPTPAPPPLPAVTTQPATNITTTGATLNGTVDGRGAPSTYHFDYGVSAAYGSSTSEANVPSAAGAVAVNQGVSGLTCGTSYHHRVVGTNAGGQSAGGDRTFSTAACPPTVTVSSSGDCHPICTVNFTATTTNTTSVTWSGCASGTGNQATCSLNSLEVITATATATGAGGTAQASATARGTNAPPVVTCLGNYYFPTGSDQAILYAVDDPDDPASTGTGSATYDKGSVYRAGFRPGGTQNIWEVGIHVGFGHGTATLTYKDRWGAQASGNCPVTGT